MRVSKYRLSLAALGVITLSTVPLKQTSAQAYDNQTRANLYRPYKDTPTSRGSAELQAHYDVLAEQLKYEIPYNFDFGIFRASYTQTKYYDPVSLRPSDRLLELSEMIVETNLTIEQAESALAEYNKIIARHIANIGVLNVAINLAEEHKILGGAFHLRSIRNALFEEVKKSGTGYSLANAYRVISPDEETMLLRYKNINILESKTVKEGFVYYNMHDVINRNTGKLETVFIDISIPMRQIDYQNERLGIKVVIPKL